MIDLGDSAAITAYGRDALDPAVVDDIATTLAGSPMDDVVAALDALDRAMLATDPGRLKRSVGFFARLLGADIEAQARGAQLQERMGVLLADAQRQAERLAAFVEALERHDARLEAMVAAIDARVEAGERWLAETRPNPASEPGSPVARFRHRLSHLAMAAASHRITQQHLRLTRAQCQQLLDRHAGIRDVLRPVWQQQRIATRGE